MKMGILKGDIKKAIGLSTIVVNGVEIDLSQTTWKEIVEFQELPFKVITSSKVDNIKPDEILKLNKLMIDWFVNYFKSKDSTINEDELRMFVVKNLNELRKEFTIGFGLKSRDEYEKEESELKDEVVELKKK